MEPELYLLLSTYWAIKRQTRSARRLFEELERIDQTHETSNWDDLSDAEKSLYELALRADPGST